MAHCQQVFLLFFGWSYIFGGYCVMLKDHFAGLKRNKDWHNISKTRGRNHPTEQKNDLILHGTASEHMRMLYEKYNREGFHFEDGNTVRSFKAHSGNINNNQFQIFNLSSLTRSEDILSVTLHYHFGELQNSSRRCAGSRTFGCQLVHFSIWSFPSANSSTNTEGHFLTNVTTMYRDGMSWQWKDITHAINQARHHSELLIGIYANTDGQRTHKTLLPDGSIYILVHANDLTISESESIMSTLRRHTGALVSRPHRLSLDTLNTAAKLRARRSSTGLLPLQNNELPGTEHPHRAPNREGGSPLYEATEDRPAVKRSRAKLRRQQQDHRMALLRFDEQTMKKARKRQGSEPRHCARRHLKVDFADIGWNEWIISPKYFEAFYCSGSCQFPVPKSVKSSNHATIQSIVRAVGVVPGIPEPCCVPEKMSSLSVLFLDENHNVVLKNYPNMTVVSCACQ